MHTIISKEETFDTKNDVISKSDETISRRSDETIQMLKDNIAGKKYYNLYIKRKII